MNELQKEKIGLRIHTRLRKSIQRQQKTKLFHRIIKAAILLCVFSAVPYYLYFKSANNNSEIDKGKHLTADFRAGHLHLDGGKSIKISEISNNSSAYPIQVTESDGMMIIRAIDNQFTITDSIRINVHKGGFYKIILEDSSSVYLNSNTKIAYTGDFLNNRTVHIEGEAYFEIAKLEKHGKPQAFTVHTKSQKIEVLGTAFNVRTYDDLKEETTLIEGKIKLHPKGTSRTINLVPEMKATVSKNGDTQLSKVDTELYTAWKEGYFYYDSAPLKDILEDLNRYYNINFIKHNVPDIRYTLYLQRKVPFSEIIAWIEKSSNIVINFEDKSLKFTTRNK
ncbi:FecR domain-containing protein [Sphingobacterium sp. UT-1RO-CII-1]|uniref:FecR family protein n=1 Tax=Sphingobacterium sp. UT-1RO-CII-1 TaxID=2995225 RepID=UPI00227BB3D8|nr:FecR family protein [Sphingobacterium sp. UT-1RO-CII-1]MCY4778659.1 FecR domain-containing protein [Sphingobacterium sp. UT-1RO-CII-1]